MLCKNFPPGNKFRKYKGIINILLLAFISTIKIFLILVFLSICYEWDFMFSPVFNKMLCKKLLRILQVLKYYFMLKLVYFKKMNK